MPTTAVDRVRVRARRIQGQKLQAIGQLAAGIAHEINNPIGYILGNLSVLDEYARDLGRLLDAALEATAGLPEDDERRARTLRLAEELDAGFLIEDFRKAAEESRQGAERIRDIVRSLKAFAHVDDGEARPVDLEDVLEEALRIASNELKYKATVRREIADVPPIRGHALGLEQVFVNLLVNAAQAIEGRGEVVVALAREGDEAVVRVRDTGRGVAREARDRLFEPFFTTKPAGKGTGLGLHVARTIVDAHGGRIELFSEPGRGAEVVVRFPLGEVRR